MAPRGPTGRRRGKPEARWRRPASRSEEHTSELQSLRHLVCRILLEKNKRRSLDHGGSGPPGIILDSYGQARGWHRGEGAVDRSENWLTDFFKDTATTEIYTLSLPGALPI